MTVEVHEHPPDLIKPGNEEYLSYYNYQAEWKPTKPIGEIGAMNTSPGPAIVCLPSAIGEENHDPRRSKAPAYKMGFKDEKQTFSSGPGPAFYDVRKMTNKGQDVCHAPKLGEKIEGFVPFRSPGPAAYHKGDSDKFVFRKSPAFSMRPKTKPLKGFLTPAPASYTLPDTLGPGRSPFKRSPAYTMGDKLDKAGLFQQQNPGPAAYPPSPTNINKPRSPAFTMRTKDGTPKTEVVSPGPQSKYNYYHMVKFNKFSTPRSTFGIRHTPFKAFQRFAAET